MRHASIKWNAGTLRLHREGTVGNWQNKAPYDLSCEIHRISLDTCELEGLVLEDKLALMKDDAERLRFMKQMWFAFAKAMLLEGFTRCVRDRPEEDADVKIIELEKYATRRFR